MDKHEKYMHRCIQLALNAVGNTSPNPMVGSVIVYDDRIIGEGYHTKAGEPHAEVNAINSIKKEDLHLLNKATIYVSLEPCAHFGKTPPCSDLIIEKNIPKIVIGCIDPFAEVAGKGVEKLLKAGRNVVVGVLEEKALQLNKRFFTFHEKQRPYIILKWAQTLDGFLDKKRDNDTGINWITSNKTKLLTHKWRSEEDAILVGKNTVINDNPNLTTREVNGKNPTRIVIDSKCSLKNDFNLFNSDAKTIVINTIENKIEDNIEYLKVDESNFINNLLHQLYLKEIQSVIIEGGATTIQHFIDSNHWDEVRVLIGQQTFGQGLEAPKLNAKVSSIETFNQDQIIYYTNNKQ